MSELSNEFISINYVVAFGRRKMVVPPEAGEGKKPKDWEVYVRLLSGGSFAVANGLSKKAAKRKMIEEALGMQEQAGVNFVTTEDDFIIMHHVARVYIDNQTDAYACVVEDASGCGYVLELGSKSKCESAMREVAGAILSHLNQRNQA